MTQYSYKELREALDKATADHDGIAINGFENGLWLYNELVQLQTILDYLPEKSPRDHEGNKVRSDAWVKVMNHPIFDEVRGTAPILEAILEKLDELHRGPLPTEYGSIIKNVIVVVPRSGTREHDYMQLTNIGWMGVDKGDGVLRDAQPEHITSWEPIDSE